MAATRNKRKQKQTKKKAYKVKIQFRKKKHKKAKRYQKPKKTETMAQREVRLQKHRAKDKKRRDKRREDPIAYANYCEKEKARNQARKVKGVEVKFKKFEDLSAREKRARRKQQKTWKENYKTKHSVDNESLPLQEPSDESDSEQDSRSVVDLDSDDSSSNATQQERLNSQQEIINNLEEEIERLKVKLRGKGKQTAREKKKKNKELVESKKKTEAQRKTITRLQGKLNQKAGETKTPAPYAEFKNAIEKSNLPKPLQKQVVTDHIITHQLSNDYKNKKLAPEERRVVSKAVNSEAIKENKMRAATHNLIPIFRKGKKQFNKRAEVKAAIQNFYLENSVIDPGKKSFIKIKGEKFQKQYLSHSIIDLWDKFNTSRRKQVSYPTFARHRPLQCIFPNVHGRDTCAFLQHENMKYLVNYLHSKKIIAESSDYKLSKAVTCEKPSLDCLSRKCVQCKDRTIDLDMTESVDQTHSFKIWKSIKEKRKNEKTGREMVVTIAKKVEVKFSTSELEDYFYQEFENFLSHLHKIFHQARAYKGLKSSVKDNEAIIIMDFSQNYQCKYNVETQGVHFGASRTQVTLHTGVLYTKNGAQGFVTLSENLRHDSCAVTAHLEETLKQMISKGCLDKVDTLHFMSDGPTAQYKNKNMFFLTTQYLVRKFPRFQKLTHNYSESGHGKNAADGIGAQ